MPTLDQLIAKPKKGYTLDELAGQEAPPTDAGGIVSGPVTDEEAPEKPFAYGKLFQRQFGLPEPWETAMRQAPTIGEQEAVERYYETHPERKPRKYKNFIDELLRNMGGGALNVASGLTGTLASASEGAIWEPEQLEGWAQKLHSKAKEPAFTPAKGGGWKGFVAASIGQAGPYMGVAVGATMLTGTPLGAFGVGFAVEGDNAYRDAIEAGASEEDAQMNRFIVGTINGAIEQMQVSRVFKFAKAGKGSAKGVLKAASNRAWKKALQKGGKLTYEAAKHSAAEALEEVLQETTQIVAISKHDPKVWDQATQRILMSGLGGATVGLLLGGGGRVMTNIRARVEEGRATPEQLEVMQQTATKLDAIRQRGGPTAAQAFRETIADGQKKLAKLEGEEAAAEFEKEIAQMDAELREIQRPAEKAPEAPSKPSAEVPPAVAKEPAPPTEAEAVPAVPPTGEAIEKKVPAEPTVEKPATFEQEIRNLSDEALGKSLNRMIKIRSEISDLAVDEWRKDDTDRKIAFMQAEWERRAKAAKPAEVKTPKEIAKEKVEARRGIAYAKPVLDIHKTFMRVLEPSKAVERKLGKEAYAAVIKGIHIPEAKRLEFEQTQLPKHDRTFQQLAEALNKFSDKDLDNLMLSRGDPVSVNAQLIKRDAINKLPKELKGSGIQRAVQNIADFNYKYLQSVVGDDINRVADYFYGIYKDSKKVDKFLDYWRTTKRFTKEKKLPTYADAKDYGLEIRDPNPINNLRSEYVAIARLEGMNWLKDELMRTGEGKFIDNLIDAPVEWDKVQDPIFSGLRLQPDLAKLINSLISTNKITRVPIANTLRQTNNFLRTIKFIGSAFHLLSVAKQSIADSGYFGFLLPQKWVGLHKRPGKAIPVGLHKGMAAQGITLGFRKNDPIFRTPFYKRYIRNAGGHRYSVESESRRAFSQAVNELNRNMGRAVKAGALPLQIPLKFVNWMFNSYIPKVKYAKTQVWYNQQAKKLGRELTDAELQEIIKEGQNFYGMMNERLFGRSGTVTTALRFYFMSPGYAEGNYRTMIKAATQWGGKEGFRASRSRSNIINSLILTGTLATVGTMIMTGKPPKKPETAEDLRDLFKIDTGRTDDKGRRIMIDLMTYDKDYWQVAFNVLKGRPDVAVKNAVKRIGGMKAPTADMIVDLALISMGRAVYDWKGDRITEITDPFLVRAMKLTTHEVRKLEPISVSVYKQSVRKDIDKRIAATEALLGVRPTMSEKDKREKAITNRVYSLRGQKEKLDLYLGSIKEPRQAIERYNKTVKDILDSPLTPQKMKMEWEPKLLIDVEKRLENKAYYLSLQNRTPEEIKRTSQYLKNFGVTPVQAQEYLDKYWAREKKKVPVSPLERDRVIGRTRKRKRLMERMTE